MELINVFLAGLIGYFAGSISFARIITRRAAPQADLSQLRIQVKGSEESVDVGIMGANAASMLLGPKLGLLVAFLDMAKVAIPMLVFRWIFPGEPFHLVVAVAGLVGHNWPIYYRFKGGRGFAVILASFLVVDWSGTLIVVVGGLAFGMVILGNPMIAYISWLWWMIPWLIWKGDPWEVYFVILINILFIVATIPEMRVIMHMRKTGKLKEYTEGLYGSSPRWRGMNKMTQKLWLLRPLFRKDAED